VECIVSLLMDLRNYLTNQEMDGGYFSTKHEGTLIAVAMDTAEDAAEAMLAYERATFEPDAFGDNYLRLYGFLQAVFLQQDALEKLQSCFPVSTLDIREMSGWQTIRKLRNRTIGHPVKRGEFERIFLTRVSLNQWFFQYQIWNDKSQTFTFHDANLMQDYEAYKHDAARLLREILATLPEDVA